MTCQLTVRDDRADFLSQTLAVALPRPFLRDSLDASRIDGISIEGMMERWKKFENPPQLDDISPEVMERARASVEAHRTKIREMSIDVI